MRCPLSTTYRVAEKSIVAVITINVSLCQANPSTLPPENRKRFVRVAYACYFSQQRSADNHHKGFATYEVYIMRGHTDKCIYDAIRHTHPRYSQINKNTREKQTPILSCNQHRYLSICIFADSFKSKRCMLDNFRRFNSGLLQINSNAQSISHWPGVC